MAQGRIGWIDRARGLGMALVVVGHAAGGLIDSPLGAGQAGLRWLFFAIYLFHMPLFFLLSGLLVTERIATDRSGFLRGLLPGVVWPYFLWSTVQFSVIVAMGSLVNRPAGAWLPTLLALPWRTVSQFWFLYALFWMHLLAGLLLPRVGKGVVLALGIGLKLLVAFVPVDVTIKLVANNFVWYALGAALGTGGVDRALARGRGGSRAMGGLAVAVLAGTLGFAIHTAGAGFALNSSPELANLAWRLGAIPAALAGVWLVLKLAASGLASGWAGAAAAALGRRTMAVFVLHVLFIAGLRIVLVRLGWAGGAWPLMVPLVGAGIAGPLVVERLLRPLGLRRVLGF